jgi:histidine triad (HIT) family protein
VERLMRRLGLRGVIRGRAIKATVSDKASPCPSTTPMPAPARSSSLRVRHGTFMIVPCRFPLTGTPMTDTLFSKIIRRELPADIVYEDEHVLAFRDIKPEAPVHVLFVPKRAKATLDELTESDAEYVGRLLVAAAAYARREGFTEAGYRVVFNCNGDAGQTVFHIHLHLLAGKKLGPMVKASPG